MNLPLLLDIILKKMDPTMLLLYLLWLFLLHYLINFLPIPCVLHRW
jgi:hypothetical protein